MTFNSIDDLSDLLGFDIQPVDGDEDAAIIRDMYEETDDYDDDASDDDTDDDGDADILGGVDSCPDCGNALTLGEGGDIDLAYCQDCGVI